MEHNAGSRPQILGSPCNDFFIMSKYERGTQKTEAERTGKSPSTISRDVANGKRDLTRVENTVRINKHIDESKKRLGIKDESESDG